MLIYLFISLSCSVKRFCLCQPDRLTDSCSLKKKCHRYFSQSDIILYNSHTNFNKSLISNQNSSQLTANTNFNYLLFEIFGSQADNKKNRPISINMLDELFSNIKKLSLYGGELNQVVYIKNMNSLNISLEVQNLQVIFDDENQFIFNKLSLRNSLLKFQNKSSNSHKSKLIINAQEVIGDSISLSLDYFSLINTEKLQVTDKKEKDFNISNNFGITAPVKINDINQQKSIQQSIKKTKILNDETLSSNNRFENYYCLATQSRLSRSKELQECEAYSVPIQNYYTSRNNDFLNKISSLPENETVRLYITLSTETDPIRINFPPFLNKNITVSIISANVDRETRIEVKGRSDSSIDLIKEKNTTISVSKIDYFLCDSVYLQSFYYVQLYQSPIYISDSNESTIIQNLITDGTSIAYFTNTNIRVNLTMQLSRATPTTLLSKVFLEENCSVNVMQYSNFPITRYNIENNTYYLTLSDSIEDQKLNLYFNNRIIMNYIERKSIRNTPTLTFASGKTIKSLQQRAKCPYIYFTIDIQPIGAIVNYGTGNGNEFPFPRSSVFIYNAPTDEKADFNLTINDFKKLSNNITDMFALVLDGQFRLNVMTSDTIQPYLLGINKKYSNENCFELYHCTNDTRPSFYTGKSCYQIGGYDLSLINLDVQDKLQSVTYNETAVLIGMKDSGVSDKFPKIADLIELTTSTNDTITFHIDNKRTHPDNITELQINLEGTPTLVFDKSYNTSYLDDTIRYYQDNDAMGKLTINHGSNYVNMIGDSIPVPLIKINDPVIGVLFKSNDVKFPLETVSDSTFKDINTRYGPDVSVSINSVVNYPQEAFLSENVIFSGNSQRLHFIYHNESRSKYTFNNINVDFVNDKNKVDFKGKYLNLQNAQISKTSPLTINVDELHINSINSIPMGSVSSPVIVNKILNISLNTNSNSKLLQGDSIKQIIFGEDSVTLIDQDGKRSAVLKTADPNTQTIISTNQEQEIKLSVEDGAESVPYNVNLDFTGKSANINYDKSWSNVEIPESFVTDFNNMNANNVHLSTEMMHLPDVEVKGVDEKSIKTSTHKQKLTKDLAFWIFIGFTALVFVIALILCIVGLTCCKYQEELDISSSAEGESEFAIGEIDGLPRTQAEEYERRNVLDKIKEDRVRAIEERKRKREERKRKIAEGKLVEEEDFDDDDDNNYELEDLYQFDDDVDDIYHNKNEVVTKQQQPKKQNEQKKPKNKKNPSETSEEFKLAKKKAQLNTASEVAPPPPAPPPTNNKPAESDNDAESASYNQSDVHDDDLSEVSLSNSGEN